MHCPACQGQVEPADRHCRHCGIALAGPESMSAPVRGFGRRPAFAAVAVVLVVIAAWLGWRGTTLVHPQSPAVPPAASRGPVAGDRPVDPVVAVSHAAVTLISIVDEYFDATGELPLSLADTGYSPADVHAGVGVDYERDTGRIHVTSPDGRYRFSAVLESPEEGDSWWVCDSETLPKDDWPARCRVPVPPAANAGVPAAEDGADASFPLGEREGGEPEPSPGAEPVQIP